MAELTIALLQMSPCGNDQAASQAKGMDFCRRAQRMGADIALFPEMWNIGYTYGADVPRSDGDVWRAPERWRPGDDPMSPAAEETIARWRARAIATDGPYVASFRNLARELDMAIAVTYLERWDGPPRNTVAFIDRHGAILFTYAKVHACAFDLPEAALTPGDEFFVATLDTAHGPVAVGTMICYDREFPESARVLMLQGAEIILIPNACEMESHRLGQLRARADENAVGVALANYAGPGLGHSVAYDPIAFTRDGVSRDTLIVEGGEGEDILLVRFDLAAIRDWRLRESWGNAFRQPSAYGPLLAPEVRAPFIRVDLHGKPWRSG